MLQKIIVNKFFEMILFGFSIVLSILVISSFMIPVNHKDFNYSPTNTNLAGKAFTGLAYKFYDNLKLYKIQFFFRGQQVGTEHRWHSNGNKWMEIEYKNGLPHGQARIWYTNGEMRALKDYYKGKVHGEQLNVQPQ